jgi:hypothetical protein
VQTSSIVLDLRSIVAPLAMLSTVCMSLDLLIAAICEGLTRLLRRANRIRYAVSWCVAFYRSHDSDDAFVELLWQRAMALLKGCKTAY